MSEYSIVYNCSSGVVNGEWTNSNYAWDSVSGTYAISALTESDDDREYIYTYTTATGIDEITKVEIGVSGYSSVYHYYCYLEVSFSGSYYTNSITFRIPFTASWDTYWFDVTSGTNTPPVFENRMWNNSDINHSNLGVFSEYHNPFVKFGSYYAYIDQLYWRVTYSG